MSKAEIKTFDAVVVGAGFAGIYMLHRLREAGLSVRMIEAGTGPGGVWYWNRYPGARCDVESHEYQYAFDSSLLKDWTWKERYGTQPEILEYVHFVADRLQINKDTDYNTRIASIVWDEKARHWTLTAEDGRRYQAPLCFMATGHLSAPLQPNIPGRETFGGPTYHTAEWPHDGVDFTGRRVGIVGTGSSGVQSIPLIAKQAKHLFVFQRTPAYSMPAGNRDVPPEEAKTLKEKFPELKEKAKYTPALSFLEPGEKSIFEYTPEEVRARLEERWLQGGFPFLQSFTDVMTNPDANKILADFVREKIRERVKDPKIAAKLTPTTYPLGAKRPILDTDYFETFNRDNVTLVDAQDEPIERVTPKGIIAGGHTYEFDDLVFATGFDAMTGALERIDIRGEKGMSLKDKWAAGPLTYLGLLSAGFPNLFLLSGPGSPSVLANCIHGPEYQTDWIMELLMRERAKGRMTIDVDPEAEQQWVEHVNMVGNHTLFVHTNSWYIGANVPGKPRVFMPYVGQGNYRRKCEEIAAENYKGFVVS